MASAWGPMKSWIKWKVLRIWFQLGLFYEKWPIMTPLIVCACVTHHCWYRSKIKNLLTLWFALSNAFQNGMTQPSSTHNHGGDRLQGKWLAAGQVVTVGDWAMVLPTTKLSATSLLGPENFVQIGQSVQKLFMIFQNTDSGITPVPHTGTGEKKFIPCFTTFSLTPFRSR